MTCIDILWEEYKSTYSCLLQHNELSLASDYANIMRKVLLLSCGSFFEAELTKQLKEYCKTASNGNSRLESFIVKQALNQKYHTLFDWGEIGDPTRPHKNINKFSSLFGKEFKDKIEMFQKNDESVAESIKAFLEIGHIRNILVHSNFAEYTYAQKTPEDIYLLYTKALRFPKFIYNQLLAS